MLAADDIDLSFGTGGFAFVSVDSGATYGGGEAIAIQDDGKIVAGGFTRDVATNLNEAVIARFHADGTLDTSFGDNGVYRDNTFTSSSSSYLLRVKDIAIDGQGRIVWSGEQGLVGRLNPDGTPDLSFGFNSGHFWGDGRFREVYKLMAQPDGSVVAAGRGYGTGPFGDNGHNLIFKLTPNGLPDPSFGTSTSPIHGGTYGPGGYTIADYDGGNSWESANDAAQSSDGKFVLVGATAPLSNTQASQPTVIRFNANGSVDSSFGVDGRMLLGFGGGAQSIAIDSTGRYIIGINGSATIYLVRLNPDGTFDTTFGGGDGIVERGTSGFGSIAQLVLQDDGSIVVSGSDYKPAIWRFNTDGTYDSSFGQNGVVNWEYAEPANVETANDVAIQADGKIVAIGYNVYWGGDPAPDGTFGVVRFGGEAPSCAPSSNGLVGHWRGDDNATDSADGNDGVALNGTTFAPGQIGQAFSFDGIDDAIQIAESSANLDGFADVTASAWINADTVTGGFQGAGTFAVVTKYDSRAGQGASFALSLVENGKLSFSVYGDGSGRGIKSDVPVIQPGTWTHVTGVWRGGSFFEIYVDGMLVSGTSQSSGTSIGPFEMRDIATPVNIGRFESASGSYVGPFGFFDGRIDDVRLYNRALCSDEVAALAVVTQPVVLSGRVFDDTNNDGADSGDPGIGGITVTLSGADDEGTVNLSTATLADGSYVFEDVLPGTYSITTEQPDGFLDGKETAGTLGGTVDNSHDSNTISNIIIGNDGVDATGYNFANIRPSDLQGLVWQDFNNDGEVNFGEKAIDNVGLTLTGIDDRGDSVNRSAQTDLDGVYMFVDLRPGNYTVTETQPAGFDDGLDVVGTVNGSPVGQNSANDVLSDVVIASPGSVAENYNFGERPSAGGEVISGQTATIGFWQNKNGQALIESLNGGPDSTQLSAWLATTFVNMYGDDGVGAANSNDLSGMTNAQVADFYSSLFLRKKKEAVQLGLGGPVKMDAQVMAVALATYVTNQTLAGLAAESYGFLVTENGVGTSTFNVGDAGQAFDVADHAEMAVLDLLLATNDNSLNGVLYDLDHDGDADDDLESLLRLLANDLYSAINESGDI